MKNVLSLPAFLVALIFIFVEIKPTNSTCHAYRYTPDDCGLTEEIPGDTRTQIPWTVGIFLKDDSDNATRSFYLHSTGVILGPTTVLTVVTGPLEKLSRKIRGRGHPGHFLIAAGHRSGNLSDYDAQTQVAEVSFIQPHLYHEEANRDFHFVLFHLKTTLDFSTPFVKSICLPHFQLGKNFHQNQTRIDFLHGGYAKIKTKVRNKQGAMDGESERENPERDIGLQIQLVETGLGYECVKTYEKYYEGIFPVGMFCARVPSENSSEDETANFEGMLSGCLMQGSAITHKIGHQYYLAGVTTFIRGRKGGLCRNGTVYFNSRLSTMNEWIERSVRCSPFSFPCSSDGTCIPLESVCNSVPNCPDTNSDENEILCETNRKCGPSSVVGVPLHQCNLVGGCISRDQICDGFEDCDEGIEESPVICNRDLTAQGSRSSRHISADGSSIILQHQHCPSLHATDGVEIEYITPNRNGLANCSFIPEGTFAISKCKPFYKSSQIQSWVEQQCEENGIWSDQIKFQCQPDCGILNSRPAIWAWNDASDPSEKVLPWHTLLFNLDVLTQRIKFVCGATVISSQYLVTAGHCFKSGHSLKSFKVVVAAVSKNFSENLSHERPFITEIDNVWRPEEFDENFKEGDVAVVKMKRPLTFGAAIRPACFVDDSDNTDPSQRSNNNKIQTFPNNDRRRVTSLAETGLLIHDFPSIAEMVCIRNGFGLSSGFQCVGHKNGNSVRQSETGGGLVSLHKTKFGSRYVLKGVMSYEEMQDAEPISQFTPIQKYRNWILETIGLLN